MFHEIYDHDFQAVNQVFEAVIALPKVQRAYSQETRFIQFWYERVSFVPNYFSFYPQPLSCYKLFCMR